MGDTSMVFAAHAAHLTYAPVGTGETYFAALDVYKRQEADLAVISHGHYDHTGGMEAFAEINGKAPVYIHRSALQEFYGTDDNGNMDDYNCGILWSQELKDRLADRLVFTDHVTEIDENIALIGDIKPLDEFPMTENFYIPVDADKKEFRPDPMDLSLIHI